MRPPPRIRQALEATRLPWALERGAKHIKVRLNGRFIGIIPHCGEGDIRRGTLNVVAQIKRAAREMQNGSHEARHR